MRYVYSINFFSIEKLLVLLDGQYFNHALGFIPLVFWQIAFICQDLCSQGGLYSNYQNLFLMRDLVKWDGSIGIIKRDSSTLNIQ